MLWIYLLVFIAGFLTGCRVTDWDWGRRVQHLETRLEELDS